MSTQVDPAHNLNALFIGTGEFDFSEGATSESDTAVKGFLNFGNIRAFTPNVEVTRQEHRGSYRGTLKKDKTIVTEQSITYQLRCDELNLVNLAVLFGADDGTNFTQSSMSASSGTAIAFSGGTPSVSTKWYDLRNGSGARVRKLTTVTFSALTEGTDFVLDLLHGRVRFLTTRSSSVTPVLTGPAITSSDADFFNGLIPFGNMTREGIGCLRVYDQNDSNKVVFEHNYFGCEVTAESSGEFDGENFVEITLNVVIRGAVPGVLLTRAANS